MDIIQKLNQLNKRIEEAKQKKARKEGQYEELLKSLAVYGCKTIEEAEAQVEKNLKILEEKERQLQEGIEEIEKNYDWDF